MAIVMRKIILMVSVLGIISFQSLAHDLKYKVCPPKSLGCYTGKYSLGAGLGWSRFRSQTSFWPNVRAEVGLMNHAAVELTFGGVNTQQLYQSFSAAPSFIFGAGLEFFPRELYQGFVVRLSALKHLYRQDLGNQRYTNETAVLSTVGWRWRPENYAGSFSLGLGAQKVLSTASSIQPVFDTQIAFDFNLDSIFY